MEILRSGFLLLIHHLQESRPGPFQRNAALILCRLGRTEEAIRRLRDILTIDSDDAETLQILAVANEFAAGGSGQNPTLPSAETAH